MSPFRSIQFYKSDILNLLFYCSLAFLPATMTNAQKVVQVLQPQTYSWFEGGQQISDSTARFFLTSKKSANFSHDQALLIEQWKRDSFQIEQPKDSSWPIINAAFDLIHLPLKEGSAIIGSNSFECDILFSELTFFTKEGNVKWHMGYEEEYFNNAGILSIGQVGEDAMAITLIDDSVIYFNFDGEEIHYIVPPPVYSMVLYNNTHVYGAQLDRLYKLGLDFEELEYIDTDTIEFFGVGGDARFLLGTSSGLLLIDDLLDIRAANSEIKNVISGKRIDSLIWVINHDGLFQLDSQLNTLHFFPIEPAESMKFLWSYNDTVFVVSDFHGIQHSDFVVRQYVPDKIITSKPIDISITNLNLPDQVIFEEWNGYPFAHTYRFDFIDIEVWNQSMDTITSLVINCDWGEYFSNCAYILNEWKVDSIEILPQNKKLISLGQFITEPVYYFSVNRNFCFWVDYANGKPDIMPQNDAMCRKAEIVSNISNLEANDKVIVYPNPAFDHIIIHIESDHNPKEVKIYTSDGALVESVVVYDDREKISTLYYPPGLYYLIIREKNKVFHQRFVKQ